VKTVLNAALIVSVKTYVPLIIATPSTIATAVSAARSFRPSRPLSATPNHELRVLMTSSTSAAVAPAPFLDDEAVREEQDAVGDHLPHAARCVTITVVWP